MSLTDTKIRRLKPSDKPFKVSDSHGLYLLVKPCGSRHWYCKHTRFSSTHFLRFPGFQPSVGTLLASGYSGIHGAAHCYIQSAIAQ